MSYVPPPWLKGGHMQTIYPAKMIVQAPVAYRRERWDTPDGDFIDLDHVGGSGPLVVLFHGLEGNSESHYALSLMHAVMKKGWRGVVVHFRGCSGEPNLLPRAYHSGDHEEINWILRRLRSISGSEKIFVAGVSLGGNALLKWLGESGKNALPVIDAAAAISAPIDVTASGEALGRGFNLTYTREFLKTLKDKILAKLEHHPGIVDRKALLATATFRQFDDLVTAPLHGFENTDDYWKRASSLEGLKNIAIPTLILNAKNDPFLPAEALPGKEEVSDLVVLDYPDEGGHVGFASGPFPGNLDWLPHRLLDFFENSKGFQMKHFPKEIFKAYDIRGIVGKTLTPEVVQDIGQALGSEALARGQSAIVIGRDGRLSGPELSDALARGIAMSGVEVIDIGLVATPMVYFATHHLGTQSGVMVTGSHNPPEYNGLKMVIDGETLSGETIQALFRRCETGDFAHGSGTIRQADISDAYLSRIAGDIKLARPMKIAVDCGNGVPGAYAPKLYRMLGCEVKELFCEVDGNFPNHHPDPSHLENLADLVEELKTGDAEIGLAFDGDGDRLGVVTKDGSIIFPDRQLMLFAADVLSRNPGAEIIYDVKCTRNLAPWIEAHGGKPVMWKTGHSLIKSKMKETGAALAGEMSGHIFFKERWYGFDDGLYAGARLLEYLSGQEDLNASLHGLPDAVSTPELQIKLNEGENYALISRLQSTAVFENPKDVIKLDGMRVEYEDGFGLARSSNTTPVIVLRFEADSQNALKRIQDDFRRVILQAKPEAVLPF
ncbi:MAG: alpha/beta fold hydrolase [Burkholderiales bacterium]|nr:alpha/beta fold hydrolase [Burkholderiales bacterium]